MSPPVCPGLAAEAGEGDVVKLYWSYLAKIHCGWLGPAERLHWQRHNLSQYPRAFVFDEDYVLSDITVVQFREVTDTAAGPLSPTKECSEKDL